MQLESLRTIHAAMPVPRDMRSSLDDAVRTGRSQANAWATLHPIGSTHRFRLDAIERLTPPPDSDAAARELKVVLDASRTRTPEGIDRARKLAARAAWDTWEAEIDAIGRELGPAQAERAARLVELSARRTHEISKFGKEHFQRPRPFEMDPSIAVVVPRPDGNPSYPSGHASGAWAAALILAAIVPRRAAELFDVAAEVAWSRVYGGVHFPSDVVEGVRIASMVASDVLRRDAAGLPER